MIRWAPHLRGHVLLGEVAAGGQGGGDTARLGTLIEVPGGARTTSDRALANREMLKRWQGDPLVVARLAPHPRTAGAGALEAARALAGPLFGDHTNHLSESRPAEQIQERYGKTFKTSKCATSVLARRPGVTACALDLRSRDTPRGDVGARTAPGNMKLSSGAHQWRPARRGSARARTEGAAAHDLDMFERWPRGVQANTRPAIHRRPPSRVPRWPPWGGAAIGMEDQIGPSSGKRATSRVGLSPAANPLFDPTRNSLPTGRGRPGVVVEGRGDARPHGLTSTSRGDAPRSGQGARGRSLKK